MSGTNVLWGASEDSGLVWFGEKEAGCWPHWFLQLPEEWKWRGRCWFWFACIQWQDTWEWFKTESGQAWVEPLETFAEGVVRLWNRLSREVVDGSSVSVLKRHLHNVLEKEVLTFAQPWSGQAVGQDGCCRYFPTAIFYSVLFCFGSNRKCGIS